MLIILANLFAKPTLENTQLAKHQAAPNPPFLASNFYLFSFPPRHDFVIDPAYSLQNQATMISPGEACQLVQQEIPEVASRLPHDCDIYSALSVVQEYAHQNAREKNYSRLRQCFTVAASLYETGSSAVKCAVENIFVYSISRLYAQTPEVKARIKEMIPEPLRNIYTAQVLHHGY